MRYPVFCPERVIGSGFSVVGVILLYFVNH